MKSKTGGKAVAARRATLLSVALVGALTFTGCSAANTSGSGDPAPSATETVGREAGGVSERIRVCVQNNTTQNLEYYFDESTMNDQQEFIPRQWGTMGPSALACGASKNSGFLANVVDFIYKNSAGRLIHVELNNSSAPLVFAVYYLRSGEPRDLLRVSTAPGSPWQGVTDGKVFDVLAGTGLRTFDKITAIPIDVRISDAP